MIEKARGDCFAKEWIAAWNSHDLERILAHYADDFEFSSPIIVQLMGEPSGSLRGKKAISEYWSRALARTPGLHFQLLSVLCGVRSLVIHYTRHDGRLASEYFEFGPSGAVIRSAAHYGASIETHP